MPDEAKKEAQAAFAQAVGSQGPVPMAPAPGAPAAPPPPPPEPTLSAKEMAEAAVGFCEFWTPAAVGIVGFAMNREVPPGTGILSKEEKNMMTMCGASAAYPLLKKLIEKSEMVAAVLFLGTYGAIVYRKVSVCPKKKKLVKDGTGESKPADGAATAADATVGQPFTCSPGLAKKLGCKSGTKLQKLSDGNYIEIPKPGKA